MSKKRKQVFVRSFIVITLVFSFITVFANNFIAENTTPETEEPETIQVAEATEDSHTSDTAGLDVGKFIIDHILDSHEWHLWGHTSIPLPVILIDLEKGQADFFMSSKFHHDNTGTYVYNACATGNSYVRLNEKIYIVGESGKLNYDEEGNVTNIMPLDLSITKNVFTIFLSLTIILIVFISIAKSYKKRKGMAPKGLQSFLEPLIVFVRDEIAIPSIGKDKYRKYMGYLLTLFFFIFLTNLMGLIPIFPGGANVTGNISVALVLALISFIITSYTGTKAYWLHIVNPPVPWWLKVPIPLIPLVELMGVFIKPGVLMVRLFANITAGHVIVLGFVSLIFIFANLFGPGAGYGMSVLSMAFSVFISLLELLVAFIQAYVFTLLSALYFGLADVKEHH